MDESLVNANAATHLRILVLGLIAAIVVMVVALSARVSVEDVRIAEPRIESAGPGYGSPTVPTGTIAPA